VGFRSALGVLNLIRRYPKERLEQAAGRAIRYHCVSRKSIISIMAKGLDKQPLPPVQEIKQMTLFHENIRGAAYYKEVSHVDGTNDRQITAAALTDHGRVAGTAIATR
jgi:hypothetical protein